jgi:hypothetical protein
MPEIGVCLVTVIGELRFPCGLVTIWKKWVFHVLHLGPVLSLILWQIVCIGSVDELEKLSGVTGITDIHRHKIDHITIPSRKGKGNLRRVEEVFDCWFESGR